MYMKDLINNKKFRNALIIFTLLTLLIAIGLVYIFNKKDRIAYSGELAKSMEYAQVEDGEDAVEGTDYVKFDTFFLRDIDGDGYAEKLRGSCRQIGKEDTIYGIKHNRRIFRKWCYYNK